MAYRRPEERSPSLGYRISSDRQPGIEQANIRRRGPTGRNLADIFNRPGAVGMSPRPTMPPPDRGYFGPGPHLEIPMIPYQSKTPDRVYSGLSRLGDLPGAKPPAHMIDQLSDIFGVGDRRKERYIADTQGGYPNMMEGLGSLMPYEEAAIDQSDWRRLLKLQQMGIDPSDYVESVKWHPGPWGIPGEGGPWGSPGPTFPKPPFGGGIESVSTWRTWQKMRDRLGEDAANEWLAGQEGTVV
jgi:hypothetical protein